MRLLKNRKQHIIVKILLEQCTKISLSRKQFPVRFWKINDYWVVSRVEYHFFNTLNYLYYGYKFEMLDMLYSHIHIQLYIYTCGNITNNNGERTHFFRKYTSHTLFVMVGKGCVWEVSWRLDKLQHIDPKFLCL